jgi:hypothetical protein
MSSPLNLRPGLRLYSVGCDTAVIVIKAPAATPVLLTCGGAPMTAAAVTDEQRRPIDAEAGAGSALGKRYVTADGSIEVLCTHAGTGTLAVDGCALDLKATKPLPASD